MINPKKHLSGKTILVTGGAGFIGSHLVDRLISYGAKVICFDNLSTGSRGYVDSMNGHKQFTFVLGDANNLEDLQKVFKQHSIDFVFHYAAVVGVQRTIEEPMKVLADIEGIKHILELSRQYKVKKIVYASSSEIYGNQEMMPLHEETSYYDIRMPYAMIKSAGENYFRTYWELSNLPSTVLRFFNVYGPRQESSHYGFVVGIFIAQVLRGERPTIFHDGKQTRDFTYIADNIEMSIQALLNKKADGQTFNIGTGNETSILELAEKIIEISRNRSLKPTLFHKRKLAEIKRRVADVRRAERILKYEPRYSLKKGLALTYAWYQEHSSTGIPSKHLSYAWNKKRVWVPRKNG